jgi:hypothetical protein
MPPVTAWFDGREAVGAFVENAIFAPVRPHRVQLRAGFCNGKPAFGTYEPDGEGRPAVRTRVRQTRGYWTRAYEPTWRTRAWMPR